MHRIIKFLVVLCFFSLPSQYSFSQSDTSPENDKIEVMVLGTFHFDNPNRDVIKTNGIDVLEDNYQQEIASVVDNLSDFEPTKVAVEVRPDRFPKVDSSYQAYLEGNHKLSRSELQQLGFRLGKQFGHKTLYGIDQDGKFPFEEVLNYAKEHNSDFVDYFNEVQQKIPQQRDSLYKHETIGGMLRFQNEKQNLSEQRNYYAQTAEVAADSTFEGAKLVAEWHKRNIKIFGRLSKIAEPGDRVIVIFGSGHAPLIRYFVESSADMELISPLDYL